jgi:hypothetical protein
MKRLLVLAAAVLCGSFSASSAQAGYVPLPTTLDALTPTGAYTTVSPLTFSDFTYSSASLPASGVVVNSFSLPGETGISFSGAFTAAPSTIADFSIGYTVTTSGPLITDAVLVGTGTPTGGGYGSWLISEDIFSGTTGHLLGVLNINSSQTLPVDTLVFAGQTSLIIQKDISVIGGSGGLGASVSIIDQGYSFGAVPEPASMGLLGIGLAGLLAYRRRMKKASV